MYKKKNTYDEFIVERMRKIQKELSNLQDNSITIEEIKIMYSELFSCETVDIIDTKPLIKERKKK